MVTLVNPETHVSCLLENKSLFKRLLVSYWRLPIIDWKRELKTFEVQKVLLLHVRPIGVRLIHIKLLSM